MEFTLEQIDTIAEKVLKKMKQTSSVGATVVAVSGDLGAGKTTLTQAICKALGIRDNVVSPTFVIMKRYQITPEQTLIHIDAYRLESENELLHLGWEEMLADTNNIILIEWPEKVPGLIPKDAIWVKLTHKEEGIRRVEF